MAVTATAGADPPEDSFHRNEVVLAGRLPAPAEERLLPSGDTLVTFRLVVTRPAHLRTRTRTLGIDTIDCAAWRADIRRAVLRWQPGDVVEVFGSLRRRFWRGAMGPTSRTEVEAFTVRRLAKAPRRLGPVPYDDT
jgi:single-strand DNA-binding protein